MTATLRIFCVPFAPPENDGVLSCNRMSMVNTAFVAEHEHQNKQ